MLSKFLTSAALLSTLSLTALAVPRPQSYDFGALLDAEPDVTSIEIPPTATAATLVLDSASISAALGAAATQIAEDLKQDVEQSGGISRKRALPAPQCSTVSTGFGKAPTENTPEAFLASPDLRGASSSTPVPNGYTNVYTGANGELPAYGWYGLTTLKSYDVQACANYCSSFTACSSFNIFYERLPEQDPVCNPNTNAVAQIKCVAHGWNPTSAAQATNVGQYRGKFKVVVTGGAAYTQTYSTAPTLAGYTAPKTLANGKCAINAPLDPKYKGVDGKFIDTYMGTKLFTNTPFDPSACTKLCEQTTAYAKATTPAVAKGQYKSCNYVNVFMLNKNDKVQGMQCSMYSRSWKDQEDALAVNCGYTDTRWNDKYTITRSTSYQVTPYDPITSRTDVVSTLTFEPDTLTSPESVIKYDYAVSKELLLDPIYGFTPTNDNRKGANYYSAGIYRPGTQYTQPAQFGSFGTCDYIGGCTFTAQGFTFDLISLNYADLQAYSGRFYLAGKRGGKVVATLTPRMAAGNTLATGFTGRLGSQWTNLDAIDFDSYSWPVFDNIAMIKYPTAAAQAVKRDIDPSALADPKLDTEPQPDAAPADAKDDNHSDDENSEFKPLYLSSGVYLNYLQDHPEQAVTPAA